MTDTRAKTVQDLIEACERCHLLVDDLGIEEENEGVEETEDGPSQDPTIHITCGQHYFFHGEGGDVEGERAAAQVLITAQQALHDLKVTVAELGAFRQYIRAVSKELVDSKTGLENKPLIEVVKALLEQRKLSHSAFTYIVRQIQTDPNYRHYMLGTQKLELCLQALSAISGETYAQLLVAVHEDKQPAHDKRGVDVEILRWENERLKELLGTRKIRWAPWLYEKKAEEEAERKRAQEIEGHKWRCGNNHFITRDGGPTPEKVESWSEPAILNVRRLLESTYPISLTPIMPGHCNDMVFKRGDGTRAYMLLNYYQSVSGMSLSMSNGNPGMIAARNESNEIVAVFMSMTKPWPARMCEYSEVSHLVELSHTEGLLTKDDSNVQWFVYELEIDGNMVPVAVTAVQEWEDKVFYFCGSYTMPEHRNEGYGEALMKLRVTFAVNEGAKKLTVRSRRPNWYIEHDWQEEPVKRPNGSTVLHHHNPAQLLALMGGPVE